MDRYSFYLPSPNLLGAIASVGAIVCFSLLAFEFRRKRLYVPIAIISAVVLALSQSRIAFVAAVFGIVFISRKKCLRPIACFGLTVAVFTCLFGFGGGVFSRFSSIASDQGAWTRLGAIEGMLNAASDANMFSGVGLNNYHKTVNLYMATSVQKEHFFVGFNDYLSFYIAFGIFGLLGYAIMMSACLVISNTVTVCSKGPFYIFVGVLLQAALISFMFLGLTQSYMFAQWPHMRLIVSVLMLTCLVFLGWKELRASLFDRVNTRIVYAVCVLLICVLTFIAVRTRSGPYYSVDGDTVKMCSSPEVKRAIVLLSDNGDSTQSAALQFALNRPVVVQEYCIVFSLGDSYRISDSNLSNTIVAIVIDPNYSDYTGVGSVDGVNVYGFLRSMQAGELISNRRIVEMAKPSFFGRDNDIDPAVLKIPWSMNPQRAIVEMVLRVYFNDNALNQGNQS